MTSKKCDTTIDIRPLEAPAFQIDNLLNFLNLVDVPCDILPLLKLEDETIARRVAHDIIQRRQETGAFLSLDDLKAVSTVTDNVMGILLDTARYQIAPPRSVQPSVVLLTRLAFPPFLLLEALPSRILLGPIAPPILARLPSFEELLRNKQSRLNTEKSLLQGELRRLQNALVATIGGRSRDEIEADPAVAAAVDDLERRVSNTREGINRIDRELSALDGDDPRVVFQLLQRNFSEEITRLRKEANRLSGDESLIPPERVRQAQIKELQASDFEELLRKAKEELEAL